MVHRNGTEKYTERPFNLKTPIKVTLILKEKKSLVKHELTNFNKVKGSSLEMVKRYVYIVRD